MLIYIYKFFKQSTIKLKEFNIKYKLLYNIKKVLFLARSTGIILVMQVIYMLNNRSKA